MQVQQSDRSWRTLSFVWDILWRQKVAWKRHRCERCGSKILTRTETRLVVSRTTTQSMRKFLRACVQRLQGSLKANAQICRRINVTAIGHSFGLEQQISSGRGCLGICTTADSCLFSRGMWRYQLHSDRLSYMTLFSVMWQNYDSRRYQLHSDWLARIDSFPGS